MPNQDIKVICPECDNNLDVNSITGGRLTEVAGPDVKMLMHKIFIGAYCGYCHRSWDIKIEMREK